MRLKLIHVLALLLAVLALCLAVVVYDRYGKPGSSDASWDTTCPNVDAPDCKINFDGGK